MIYLDSTNSGFKAVVIPNLDVKRNLHALGGISTRLPDRFGFIIEDVLATSTH